MVIFQSDVGLPEGTLDIVEVWRWLMVALVNLTTLTCMLPLEFPRGVSGDD